MKINKWLFYFLLLILFCFPIQLGAQAARNQVDIHFFWGNGCPHCAQEKIFLEKLKRDYSNVSVYDYEVWEDSANRDLLYQIGQQTGADIRGVPFTVIGHYMVIGYFDDQTTGQKIVDAIDTCSASVCGDVVGGILATMDQTESVVIEPEPSLPVTEESDEPISNIIEPVTTSEQERQAVLEELDRIQAPSALPEELEPDVPELEVTETTQEEVAQTTEIADSLPAEMVTATSSKPLAQLEVVRQVPEMVRIPWIGEVRLSTVSLPVLTILLGALDGFNPCAMWTLVFLIGLLLGMHNRRRMWILGTAFIIASASVYFIFMAAWLNFILFIGVILWIRLLIGLVALGGGIYNVREFLVNKAGTCKVTGTEKRQRVFDKLKAVTQRPSFWLALVGIVALAFVVNLVELVCSAGLPAIYTQILAMNDLPVWQYYSYLLLYIFIFMLDDLFIFIAAMVTLKMTGLSTKYARYSHLIGGVLMVVIGLLLMFKPEWLMFG